MMIKEQNIPKLTQDFQLIEQQDNEKLIKITNILKSLIVQSRLPEFYFPYMAGIITQEPPTSEQEVFELIGDYILNAKSVSLEKAKEVCKSIYSQLLHEKCTEENIQNKLSFITEKLNQPLIMEEQSIGSNMDINSGFVDAFLGIQQSKFDQDDASQLGQEQNSKYKQRQEKQQQEQKMKYQKFLNELEKQKIQMPQPIVRHAATNIQTISIPNFSLTVGGKQLLENTDFTLVAGRKYGLIGKNGIGKTCLLSAFARGELKQLQSHVLLVEQEVAGTDKTPIETLLDADVERNDLLKQEKELKEQKESEENSQKLLNVYNQLDMIEADKQPGKAAQILNGLGFTQELMSRQTKYLSGGWRMRVTLARALFINPDILLLDEPTNHLDLDAVMWLEQFLQNCKNTVVIVSHAREFLNQVSSDIIHFYNEKLNYYKGNYDQFDKTRTELILNQKKQYSTQQQQIQHMQSFIDRFRYNAKRASLVQSRVKALQKMNLIEEILEDPSCIFKFPDVEKLRPPFIKVEDGSFGYNSNQIILQALNFDIEQESRVAIVGANGIGKTTFLKLLNGDLPLIEGQCHKNPLLKISFFTQHHVEQLNLVNSPLQEINLKYPGFPLEAYRSHLSNFGITSQLQLKSMYLFSGGQKSRVALAMVTWQKPHLLILDEPTNHLDIDAVNALIVALNNYNGGVLLVSHDQHLIASVCDTIWYIKNKRLRKFHGDFDDYKKALITNRLI